MNLAELPYTVFEEIVSYLSPAEAILCRCVSGAFYEAFTHHDLCLKLIRTRFPRSFEARFAKQYIDQDDGAALEETDWAAALAGLVRRYHHLNRAAYWKKTTLEAAQEPRALRGVTPWDHFLVIKGDATPWNHVEPFWTFAPDDGLLVYPAAAGPRPRFRARDVETGVEAHVPFETAGRIVRRVRLADGVLVFEWCDEEAAHPLNDLEAAHCHYATAYHVQRQGPTLPRRGLPASPLSSPWSITFGAEWKMHYLGLPVSDDDRFFSAHNRTHYAVYMWQPNRAPWGGDDPLERLIVWELGAPSPYRPSLDPGGRHKPVDDGAGPSIILRLTNGELDAWGIRQGHSPTLRGLALDACTWDAHTGSGAGGHVFVHEEAHGWSAGPQSAGDPAGAPSPVNSHCVRSTGIPLAGSGPRWRDECGGFADDVEAMGFCWRRDTLTRPAPPPEQLVASAESPSRAVAWPGRAPCWRHDEYPYLTTAEAHDVAAGVRVTARQYYGSVAVCVHLPPELRTRRSPGEQVQLPAGRAGAVSANGDIWLGHEWWSGLLAKGFISGNERWVVGEDLDGHINVIHF